MGVAVRFAPLLVCLAACASGSATSPTSAGADGPVAGGGLNCERLEGPLREAEIAHDIAGSALARPRGRIRRELNGWLARLGPGRAEVLRGVVAGAKGNGAAHVRDAATALNDVVVGASKNDAYAEDYESLTRALDLVRMSCLADVPAVGEGRLEPEAIQVVVRTNFGAFRNCYEAALATQPSLAGQGRDGFRHR